MSKEGAIHDEETYSNAEATRLANEKLGNGWLLSIAKILAYMGVTIVGIYSFGWVPTAGAWVVVLWIKDQVGPAQYENRRQISIRIRRRKKRRR
ncbi:MAG: hypothetical protein KGI73_00175 [Patescibacteria group bacterium]|nr:hypothetical protein [Patescibacteria group bacterium]